jgi:hypothetical protein
MSELGWISDMGKAIDLKGFFLTRQDAADISWLLTLTLDHVTMNRKTKTRLRKLHIQILLGMRSSRPDE